MSQIQVTKKDYLILSDAFDKHSRTLMTTKGEEYNLYDDFLAMENLLSGLTCNEPEWVSLIMAGKHIAALSIILTKSTAKNIKLEKLDERVRDACNLLKIMAAFIHAKHGDFGIYLGEDEQEKDAENDPSTI